MPGLFDGYPQSTGAKRETVLEIAGPNPYVQVTTGTPPTGGQAVSARQFGLKYIEHIASQLSASGTYFVQFTPTVQGPMGVTDGILMWIVAAGGAEASSSADLDAETVNLRAIGLD